MQLEVGKIVEGKVNRITKFGAFVDLGDNKVGLVHISEVAPTFVKEVGDYIKEGQTVKVKIINLSEDGRIGLSVKQALNDGKGQSQDRQGRNRRVRKLDDNDLKSASGGQKRFEYLMSKFKMESDETQSLLSKRDCGRGKSPRR